MNNKLTKDQLIDEASKESFPASDPPSFTGGKDKTPQPTGTDLKDGSTQNMEYNPPPNKKGELNQSSSCVMPENIHDRPELQSDG